MIDETLDPKVVARLRLYREPGKGILRFAREQLRFQPDVWQEPVLEAFSRPEPEYQRIAMQACVGPGKSAVLAITGIWFLLTQGDKDDAPKGLATSVSEGNLQSNLWAEYSKWLGRSPFLMALFDWTTVRIAAKHPRLRSNWFIEARSWPKRANEEQQGATFAGLHSKYVLAQVDECGTVPKSILKKAEQALSRCIFGKIEIAGNPSTQDGMLYEAVARQRADWKIFIITGDPDDPRAWVNSPRLAKVIRERAQEWARKQIERHGRENPWIKSSILGEFPPGGINNLFPIDLIQKAQARTIRPDEYEWAQKRLGVDVARFGDDINTFCPRQGQFAFMPKELRNVRTTTIAARVMTIARSWERKPGGKVLVFVDDTGHWGHGVIDNLLTTNVAAIPVVYSDKAFDPRFYNRRAEMYFGFADWLQHGRLPNHPELSEELEAITYGFKSGKIILEEKEQIKETLGRSPNYADGYAQTFSLPDMPAEPLAGGHDPSKALTGDRAGRGGGMSAAFEEQYGDVGQAVRRRREDD